MTKAHETIRIIDGHRYCCRDVGCDDLERARYNREIVARRMFTTSYQEVEYYLTHTPLHRPLPLWIPQGQLPQVGKHESREIEDRFVVDLTGDVTEEYNVIVGVK